LQKAAIRISSRKVEIPLLAKTKAIAPSYPAWAFIGSGFALGAVIYYFTSLFLDQKGAAIRNPTRFREYALRRKRKDAKETIQLL
jgi:hypothetical protein